MKWLDYPKISLVLFAFIAAFVICEGHAKADFTFGTPTNLGPTVNGSDDVVGVSISYDGLELNFASNRPGGYGSYDLWLATRPFTDYVWGEPVNLGPTVNSQCACVAPSISSDGLQLYFSDWEYGPYLPGGIGVNDLWVLTRETTESAWSAPVHLGQPVNYTGGDMCPSISADGLSIYFASGAARGGSGYYDLWVSMRPTKDNEWCTPLNLGPIVNSSASEISPSLSSNSLTLFFCRTFTGQRDFDLWMTTRANEDDNWGMPVKLGSPVNSSDVEVFPSVSADGSTLYFCSDRAGGFGLNDLWQVSIIPIVDFNGDEIVDIKDLVILIEHWGTDSDLCDIGPPPFGDGIVDVKDLEVLMSYWHQKVLP